MTDAGGRSEEKDWLLEPSGRAGIYIAIGKDAVVSPRLREAVDGLLRALEAQEVEGYMVSLGAKCAVKSCTKDNCKPVVISPCYAFQTCRVT